MNDQIYHVFCGSRMPPHYHVAASRMCDMLYLQCKKAVDVGRTNRAGFADIGKAYSRMAKASIRMGNKEQAIAYLEDAQV